MTAVLLLPIRIMILVIVPVIAFAGAGKAVGPQPQGIVAPEGYYVYQSEQIDPQVSGFDGFLQLLQDRRVIGSIRGELWGFDEFMWCDNPSELPDFCASIKERPLLPAVIRLARADGSVVDSRTMERPLANMAVEDLYDTRKATYFVTVDHSTGAGPYAGPVTFLVELDSQSLRWLKALDVKDGKEEEIALTASLKRAWRLVPDTGGRQDILKIVCWPAFSKAGQRNSVESEVIYTRFHFDGDRWLRFERKEPGYFENEGEFPSRDEFP